MRTFILTLLGILLLAGPTLARGSDAEEPENYEPTEAEASFQFERIPLPYFLRKRLLAAFVRELDGGAHLLEQAQAVREAEPLRVAVAVDLLAVDDLHHEVGQTVLGGAAVEEARDPRVNQVGQNLDGLVNAAGMIPQGYPRNGS